MATESMVIEVCTDCWHALNGLDVEGTPDPAPLSQIGDGETITPGGGPPSLDGDHAGFSWWDCGGCDSSLGGDRFYATVTWEA